MCDAGSKEQHRPDGYNIHERPRVAAKQLHGMTTALAPPGDRNGNRRGLPLRVGLKAVSASWAAQKKNRNLVHHTSQQCTGSMVTMVRFIKKTNI